MLSQIISPGERPNRIRFTDSTGHVVNKNTSEEYHAQFARYCVSSGYCISLHQDFLTKTALNKNFYSNNQWIKDEDLEGFFKDDGGQDRNRIKITKNLIRPMIEQYRGNAIRMNINARVRSVSPQAINRREQKLAELMFFTDLATEQPEYADFLRQKLAIGKNKDETQQVFENLYVDDFVKKVNYLLVYASELNKFQEKQVRIAEEMGLSGLGIFEGWEQNGHQRFGIVKSEEFFWDRSAREYDLSDAEFQGKIWWALPTEIFERWQDMNDATRIAIDNFSKNYREKMTNAESVAQYQGGRVPVFYAVWKDAEQYEYGYVKDEGGYPYLTKINYIEQGEEEPRYTDADLIDPQTERQKRVLKGKKKRKLYVDTLRYAYYIPNEYLATENNKAQQEMVLEYGLVPYQETENLEPSNVAFPFKCYCWGYVDGQVLSPIDDAIDPQRLINRILSVAENQINNSRGSGTVYDKDMVDSADGEDEMLRNMNQSKPVGLHTKGRGVQNAIGNYDSTVKNGTMILFDIINILKGSVQDVTGVNEALKGESIGNDQLVGVTNLLIQKGSLMQEPFYNAITNVFLQSYQSVASVGKRIYADSERNISIAAGDDGSEIIKITKEMRIEDFRCFVKRENVDELRISAANQMLQLFLQLGLVNKQQFANLYNRSVPDDVARALRDSASNEIEVARRQQAIDEKSANNLTVEADKQKNELLAERDRTEAISLSEAEKDRQHDIDKIIAKQMGAGFAAGQKNIPQTVGVQ